MHGNVWEWCLDWDGGSLSGNDPTGSSSGSARVVRGGSWNNVADYCTSSYRNYVTPSFEYYYYGFRLVRTLSTTEGERSPEAVAGAERVAKICSGDSTPIAVDLSAEPVVDSIFLSWDAAWVGGDANATVVIADGEVELRCETGTGEFAYAPSRAGRHELTYTTYVDGVAQEEVYSATVYSQWKYELDGGGAFITDTTQTSGAVVVPSEIDGYPVTGMAEGVFDDCSGVTSMTMPGRITRIWPQGDGLEPLRPYDVTLSGGSFWVNDGAAMRSGEIGNGESSVIKASVEGPGKLSFRWKASSENYDGEVYDYAYLSIDGVPQGWLENYRLRGVAIGGETEWTNVVVGVLGDGPHTIRWTYCKDEVDESPVGEDCAWLDDVAWQPLTGKPTIDSDDVEDGGATDKAFASIRITADEGADIYYTLDGTDPTTNSIRYVGSFVVECMSATIRAVAAIGSYTSEVASFSFTRLPYSPAECLGVEGASVATGASDAAWGRVLGDSAHDGIAALKSGAVGDGETSSVVMTVAGPGEVAFWWKVSSEISRNRKYDYVSFRVDGLELSWLGGEKGWTNEVFEVGGGGLHTLEWVYLKNDNGLTQGQDCAWLDDVVWTPSEVIPAIAPDAAPEVVTNAIEEAGFADEAVKEAIGGSAAEYAAFKTWAGSVKGAGSASSAAAGEVAVVANTNAAAAYLLGAERLFENAPKIEFEEVVVGDGEIVDAGASTTGHQVGSVVTVTVIVKDGEEAVKCAAEKVKSLFKATSDLGDWNGAAKLDPEVSIEATDDPTTMRFKVTPGDGTSPRAFLQIML